VIEPHKLRADRLHAVARAGRDGFDCCIRPEPQQRGGLRCCPGFWLCHVGFPSLLSVVIPSFPCDVPPLCARCRSGRSLSRPAFLDSSPIMRLAFARSTSRTSQSEGRRPRESIHSCPHLLASGLASASRGSIVDRAWPPDCPLLRRMIWLDVICHRTPFCLCPLLVGDQLAGGLRLQHPIPPQRTPGDAKACCVKNRSCNMAIL